MIDSDITLRDGRTLAFTDVGEATWPCLMFFGGAPTSRLRHLFLEPDFVARQVRVVAPERPGYGRSSPRPGRSIASWAEDVAELADSLGLDRFMVAGHSSGGAYAIACAAALAPRICGALVVAGVTDMGWDGAWAGYNEMEAGLMRIDAADAAVASCIELFGDDGSGFFAAAAFELPEPDVAHLGDERFTGMIVAARAEAFRQGVVGYAHDIVAQGRPWNFDPTAVTAAVLVVHPALDTLLPLAHSRHTATMIPGSELRIVPGHGHFSILLELPALASEWFAAAERGAATS